MPDIDLHYQGMPALHLAEVGIRHGTWSMIVVAHDAAAVIEQPILVAPADTLAIADSSKPGRHLIAQPDHPVPVLPAQRAAEMLYEHGFAIDERAHSDPMTDHGFTEVATGWWTAPCHPVAREITRHHPCA